MRASPASVPNTLVNDAVICSELLAMLFALIGLIIYISIRFEAESRNLESAVSATDAPAIEQKGH